MAAESAPPQPTVGDLAQELDLAVRSLIPGAEARYEPALVALTTTLLRVLGHDHLARELGPRELFFEEVMADRDFGRIVLDSDTREIISTPGNQQGLTPKGQYRHIEYY